jgi:hypothetical protein
VWILAIHYDFSADEIQSQRRPGNARDIELLQNLFKDYHDCTYKDIASPPSQEISEILSEAGIISTFTNGINFYTAI